MESFPSTFLALISCGCAMILCRLVYLRSKLHYPPGPRPDPFIGNLRHIPISSPPEHTFAEWGLKYGDVIFAQLLSRKMVILNSLQAARDLLEKRSAIYSDRPRSVLLEELMGWQNASTNMRYGPRFRKHRRFAQQAFNQHAIRHFRPIQHQELSILLNNMVDTPESFLQHIRRYAAATIMKITYGHDVKSADDFFVQLAEKAGTATIESGTPAATLVDFFPLMKYMPAWMPGAGFKRKALECRKLVQTMMDVPFQQVKNDMKAGTASPSFTAALLEPHIKAGESLLSVEDENDIRGAAGTLFAAAEDTTVTVMHTFILAMVLHPDVLRKAQEEMDKVIGSDRMPTFEDMDSLPYLICILKEVYRWGVPVPLGLPHRLMEHDIYEGNHIPQGSMVVANIWAMSRNCVSPEQFYPERYMEESDLPDPRTMVFGFGRRICPGRHFAHSNLCLVLANFVASLTFSEARGESGKAIPVAAEFLSGFVRHPKPFACSIKPRSDKAASLIRQYTA